MQSRNHFNIYHICVNYIQTKQYDQLSETQEIQVHVIYESYLKYDVVER